MYLLDRNKSFYKRDLHTATLTAHKVIRERLGDYKQRAICKKFINIEDPEYHVVKSILMIERALSKKGY